MSRPAQLSRLLLAGLVLVCGQARVHAQGASSTGDEFILSYLPNLAGGLPTLELMLNCDVATSVTVEYPVLAPTFVTTVAVVPGTTTLVVVPNTASSSWVVDTVTNNSVRLFAALPFNVLMANRKGATSDGALGLPVDGLGLEYFAADYDPPAPNPGGQIAIVATVDGTTVTITPSVPLDGGHATGVPFNVSLNRGEAYFGMTVPGATVGLTGTHIVADQRISVSNGSYCPNVPTTISACDHIFEVAVPVEAWSDSYLAANVLVRPDGTIYRVLAATNATVVNLDGVPVAGSPINAGEFIEIGPLPGDHVVDGSAPIMVTQYITGEASAGAGGVGDPAMCNLIGTDKFQTDHRFSTFLPAPWDNPILVRHYLAVFALDADVATITLNGTPIGASSFSSIPGTGYSVAKLDVLAGTYRTESVSGHGVLVIGFRNGPEAYMYPAGTALEPVAVISDCQPDGLDGGTCCAPAQPVVPKPKPFTQDCLAICWTDCDVEATSNCYASWTLGSTNLAPCAIRRMTLRVFDASATLKWRGRLSVQYSRTWREVDDTGATIQVWRYLANGDLKPTASAGTPPCPVPPCAAAFSGRVRFTGYLDMARSCDDPTLPPNFAWMLNHACDEFDHAPGFPRAGGFHPNRSYSFVGPSAGFVPAALQPIEMGVSDQEASRRVNLFSGVPMCTYEEPIDLTLNPVSEYCPGSPAPGAAQFVLSDLSVTGMCGTSATSGGPFLPGFVSMSVGAWTDPGTYPGIEGLRWNTGGYFFDDCFGIGRDDVFFGVTTLAGHDAFTIPSIAGTASEPLLPTFIDQCNALRSGTAVMNVPWKRSDHFLNLNLP